jgi:serine/threonine protein kinase
MDHIPSIDDLRAALPQLGAAEFVTSGGFKAVFRAELSGHVEALKVILLPRDEGGAREQIVARVEREIEVLSRCHTPSIVKLGSLEATTFAASGHDYLAYSEEFLPGQPVIQLINARLRTSFETIVSLTRGLLEALNEIASLGHIHRDVKPHNVMATEIPGRPFVVLDLGIAFKLHGTELTAPGAGPPGTLLYMAPELFRPNYKDVLDTRSDIYSAGVTIFEFAAGEHPLARRGEDVHTTVYRILKQPPPKLDTLRDDLPDWFCRMIDRCIKKTPALRFRDPQAVLSELEKRI